MIYGRFDRYDVMRRFVLIKYAGLGGGGEVVTPGGDISLLPERYCVSREMK